MDLGDDQALALSLMANGLWSVPQPSMAANLCVSPVASQSTWLGMPTSAFQQNIFTPTLSYIHFIKIRPHLSCRHLDIPQKLVSRMSLVIR